MVIRRTRRSCLFEIQSNMNLNDRPHKTYPTSPGIQSKALFSIHACYPRSESFHSHASAPNSQLTEMALKPILPGWFRGLFCAVPGLEKSPMIQNLLSRKAPLTRQPEMLASNLDQEKSHGGPVPSCHHS